MEYEVTQLRGNGVIGQPDAWGSALGMITGSIGGWCIGGVRRHGGQNSTFYITKGEVCGHMYMSFSNRDSIHQYLLRTL